MRVVLAGGGSAGHIEPALALADALRQADSSIQVTCLGTSRGLETRLVPLRGYDLELIPAVPLPRSVTPQLLTVPGRLAGAVHGVGTILDRVRADVLVGFGGYVATPAYLAARRHHVPIVVHEANPLPGIANRLGAHLTTHVFTGHPDTKLRNSTYLGIPIRRQIAELDRFALGDKARAHFGLRLDLPVLLVTGGSQGAMSLNRALAGAVAAITSAGVQVLHVTGPKHLNEIKPPSGPVPYVAVPYVDQMDLAYAAADFALCRAGAMTCAELTAVGLPGAYVPLPHGNGEQRLNALPIVQRGGGLLVDDAELTGEWIRSSLLPVLTNIDQVAGMSEAAAAMGRKDADRWLAKAVIDVVAAESANRAAEAAGGAAQAPNGTGQGPSGTAQGPSGTAQAANGIAQAASGIAQAPDRAGRAAERAAEAPGRAFPAARPTPPAPSSSAPGPQSPSQPQPWSTAAPSASPPQAQPWSDAAPPPSQPQSWSAAPPPSQPQPWSDAAPPPSQPQSWSAAPPPSQPQSWSAAPPPPQPQPQPWSDTPPPSSQPPQPWSAAPPPASPPPPQSWSDAVPPAPAPSEPGSLFTPRTTRQSRAAGSHHRPQSGPYSAAGDQGGAWPDSGRPQPAGQGAGWGRPPLAEEPRHARGQDAPGQFGAGQAPSSQFAPDQPGQSQPAPGQPAPGQPPRSQPPRSQPPQSQTLPSRTPSAQPPASPPPSGPGRHRQGRS